MKHGRTLIHAVLSMLLVGCSGVTAMPTAGTPASDPPIALTIYGAASLKGVLDEVKVAYEAASGGTTLTISTDSSSALATQIEQGAPVDIFLSADTTNPDRLVEHGLTDGDPATFAANGLAVIVPADNPARITTPADLARPGIRIVAAGDKVPITTYATQLIANLASESGYPAGFAASYAANVVSREDNVKAIVAKLELGEGDAGVVYVTDAVASMRVRRIDVPEAAGVSATYAGVIVKASPNVEAARAFLDWFAGPGGQAILGRFGFLPPS